MIDLPVSRWIIFTSLVGIGFKVATQWMRKDQNRPLPFSKSATTKIRDRHIELTSLKTIAIVVLLAGTARAQVLPGDSPNMGVGAAVSGSRGLGVVSRPHTWEGYGFPEVREDLQRDRKKNAEQEAFKRSVEKRPTGSDDNGPAPAAITPARDAEKA